MKDVNPAGPIFDVTKLAWMNQQYIQNLSDADLSRKLTAFYPELRNNETIGRLIPLVKTRMNTLKDFSLLAHHFLSEPEVLLRDESERKIAQSLLEKLSTLSSWEKDTIFQVFKDVMAEYTIKMPVLYALLTGSAKGLPLPESVEILGKKRTLARLERIAKTL